MAESRENAGVEPVAPQPVFVVPGDPFVTCLSEEIDQLPAVQAMGIHQPVAEQRESVQDIGVVDAVAYELHQQRHLISGLDDGTQAHEPIPGVEGRFSPLPFAPDPGAGPPSRDGAFSGAVAEHPVEIEGKDIRVHGGWGSLSDHDDCGARGEPTGSQQGFHIGDAVKYLIRTCFSDGATIRRGVLHVKEILTQSVVATLTGDPGPVQIPTSTLTGHGKLIPFVDHRFEIRSLG